MQLKRRKRFDVEVDAGAGELPACVKRVDETSEVRDQEVQKRSARADPLA